MTKFYHKAILLLTVLFLFFTAAPAYDFSVCAAAKETYLTEEEAMQWLSSTVGTRRGDGQCIAFIKDYYEVLAGYAPRGDAADFSFNELPRGLGWKRIKGEKRLKKGDILIWTGGTGGNGHAAIYGGDGKYYHQNWSGKYVQIIGKSWLEGFRISRSNSYAYYWGVIRPSFRNENADTDSTYRLRNTGTGLHLTDRVSSEASVRRFKEFDLKTLLVNLGETEKEKAVSAKKKSTKKKRSAASDSAWKIQKLSDSYVIRNAEEPSLCLASDRKTGKLTVEEYKGYKHQKWGTQDSAAEALSAKTQSVR